MENYNEENRSIEKWKTRKMERIGNETSGKWNLYSILLKVNWIKHTTQWNYAKFKEQTAAKK